MNLISCTMCKVVIDSSPVLMDNNSGKVPNTDSAKTANETPSENEPENDPENDSLLVDTGATAHIVISDENFIDVDDTYAPENHYIELADGSRTLSAAKKRGTVLVNITDEDDIVRTATLHNALYCPGYPQNIFSVKSATERGHSVHFSKDNNELISKGGVKFPIHCDGGLYFL